MSEQPEPARRRNKEIVNRILFDGFVGGDLSLG